MNEITLDVVRKKLEKIGLKYSADNLSFLLGEAVKEDMSLHNFLDMILTEELERREEERIKMWLRLSSLPPGKTLENFDFSFQPSISKKRIEMLATGEYVRRCENILFLGPPGVGKSHLGTALGVRAVECGFRVIYRRLDDLIRMLKEDATKARAQVRRRGYYRARLLIIDDMGFDPLTLTEANSFFHLISRLYENSSVILTSNKAFRDWPGVFAGDEVMVTAILDRLLHHSHVINIQGRSWRLKEMEEAIQFSSQEKIKEVCEKKEVLSQGEILRSEGIPGMHFR